MKPKIIKQSEENIIKNIRNLFKLKKENQAIKDRIIRDIKSLFEKEEDYDKTIREGNAWNNNYIEYESNGNKNKILSIKEHHDETKPHLKDVIKNLQKSYVWKIQLTIEIISVSSKDTDEERIMHLKSDSIELVIRDKADEVIKKHWVGHINKRQ